MGDDSCCGFVSAVADVKTVSRQKFNSVFNERWKTVVYCIPPVDGQGTGKVNAIKNNGDFPGQGSNNFCDQRGDFKPPPLAGSVKTLSAGGLSQPDGRTDHTCKFDVPLVYSMGCDARVENAITDGVNKDHFRESFDFLPRKSFGDKDMKDKINASGEFRKVRFRVPVEVIDDTQEFEIFVAI
jgi:hypothetical protein